MPLPRRGPASLLACSLLALASCGHARPRPVEDDGARWLERLPGWENACAGGDGDACALAGAAYAGGRGVPPDARRAVRETAQAFGSCCVVQWIVPKPST